MTSSPSVDALKQWTGKTSATVLNHSTAEESTNNGNLEGIKIKEERRDRCIHDCRASDGFDDVAVIEQNMVIREPNPYISSFVSHGR